MKCGIFEHDITPKLGCEIPGYFEVRRAEGILDRLFTHAVYLEDSSGQRIVIISSDALQIPEQVANTVRPAIAAALNMDVSGVLVCATHIHTGGPVFTWDEFSHEDDQYLDFFSSRMIDAAIQACQERREVKIGYASGIEQTIAHCRDFLMSDGTYRTNPPVGGEKTALSPVDPEVNVIRIDEANGGLYGAIIGYACHTDCVGGKRYSSDFPGALKETLRNLYGNSFMPVFVNGFLGNVNQVDFERGTHRSSEYYRTIAWRLAAQVSEAMNAVVSQADVRLKCISGNVVIPTKEPDRDLLAWADRILAHGGDESVVDRHYASEAKRIYAAGVRGINIPLQVLKIGQLTVFASPRELFVDFQLQLKEKSLPKKVMCIGLANGPCGYVPIKEAVKPGIYEARINGNRLNDDAGYIIVRQLLALSSQLEHEA